MPYDISDIKKLPVSERLRIIDEIWESCVELDKDALVEDDNEFVAMVEERDELYESGKMKAIPWNEFISKLRERRK